MSDSDEDAVLEAVTEFYLESRFNGIPWETLSDRTGCDPARLRSVIARLVEARRVDVLFAADGDPHTKRLPPDEPEQQIARLDDIGDSMCVYPALDVLEHRQLAGLDDRPYTLRLGRGQPQLTPVFFELSVLERYYRDPGFAIDFDDVVGVITRKGGIPGQPHAEDLLPSFGVGYRAGGFRVLLVPVMHLSNMPADHQLYWSRRETREECVANSDYVETTSFGRPRQYTSVYRALLGELDVLNSLCEHIGRPSLFLRTYPDLRVPGFHGMLRPTRRAFCEFLQLLDGLLPANMNRDFFRDETDLDAESAPAVDLLHRWLAARFSVPDQPDAVATALAPLRAIVKASQESSPAPEDDEIDLDYPKRQDRLVADGYRAVRWLRGVLQEHPHAGGYRVPDWLEADNIVVY